MGLSRIIRGVALAGLIASIWGTPVQAAAPPGSAAGVTWLQSQLQTDGSFTNANGIATNTQAESEALRALTAAHDAQAMATAGLIAADTSGDTETLSRQILALVGTSQSTSTLVTTLLTAQNPDGGFGDFPGYQDTYFDTAYALVALNAAGQGSSDAAHNAALYLVNKQGSDGSWTDWQGTDTAYSTALAIEALAPYRLQLASMALAIKNAEAYLSSVRQSGTDWNESFIDAQVVMALAAGNADPTFVTGAAGDLANGQLADGSWGDDVFTTALALQALAAVQATAPPTQSIGSATGYVVEAGTGRPIAGATVFLASNSQVTTTTNSSGYFTLSNLPAGQLTFVGSAAGYGSTSVVATIMTGASNQVGQIVLAQGSATAMVYGKLTSQQNGTALAGASVQLTGGSSPYSTTTAADGSFVFPAVTPGPYTLVIGDTGFISISAAVTLTGGEQLQADQALLLTGTYQNSAPVTVTATVVDAATGNAISGAQVSLGGSLAGSAGSDGSVSIASVPMGAYQATVSANGYTTASYSFVLSPGSNGALGALSLYHATGVAAPGTLTLITTVVDGLSNKPIAGATVTDTDTGATVTTDANGIATFIGLTALSVNLQATAAGYATQAFTVTSSGFGTVAETLVLPATGGTSGGTAVSLSGAVTDASTGSPISGATVALSDATAQFVTGSTGSYQLPAIPELTFSLQVTATGYITQTIPVTVSQFGSYTLDIQLTPAQPASTLQVLAVDAKSATLAATDTGVFTATIGNTGSSDVQATLVAEVTDAQGAVVAEVSGQVPGGSTKPATFDVPASGQIQAEFDWAPEQLPAAGYTVTVYAQQPGTATRTAPHGVILAQGNTTVSVSPTDAMTGQLAFSPPLSQAGSQTPVAISALVINSGNETLATLPLHVTVTDPASGNIIYSADTQATQLAVNNNVTLNFGSWLPTTTGNLKVQVVSTDPSIPGTISGTLYVGNKATAQMTVDKTLVAPGSNTVHAKVAVQGVDISQAISVDPMFYAVQRATSNAGAYVAPNAEQWVRAHGCVSCHIESESLYGLSGAAGKATIDPHALKFLATAIGTAHENNGSLEDYFQGQGADVTQTDMNLWALDKYQDNGWLFRIKLAAAMFLHSASQKSGAGIRWPDEYSGSNAWWLPYDGRTALAIKGIVGVLQAAPQADPSTVVNYTWQALDAAKTMTVPNDMKLGPDGRLYIIQNNDTIHWYDPISQAEGNIVIQGLPASSTFGIAVAPDGSFYISGVGYIAHLPAGQTTPAFVWKGSGTIWDVALSPSGVLYAVNFNTSQLLRFDSATPTVVLGSSTLNEPSGLAFDSAGNLMIADNVNGDLVEVAVDGTVSQFASGLNQHPVWVVSDGQGGWYSISWWTQPLGSYDGPQLFHFRPDGVGQNLLYANGNDKLFGVALLNGVPVTTDATTGQLLEMVTSSPVDVPAELNTLQQDVVSGANYLLGDYQDGNTSFITQALRLWGMGEARNVVTDPTLQNRLSQGIAYLDTKLRSEQRSDGGWGYQSGAASDAMVTAIAGLALDYSHPSASDMVTRNAIQYLLNKQLGDGSWNSADGIMQTHLAATGLVMDYLPEALQFLGGIDVDLYVQDVPGKVSLGSFAPTVSDTVIGGDGSSTYNWHMTGVTSEEDVTFDVNLPNMLANETRPAAGAAYLQFKNSFTGELLTTQIDIPQVQAVSGLGITVGTDRPQYPGVTPVVISGNAGNNGVPTVSAQVLLTVTAPDGTVVATLPAIAGLAIPTSGELPYSAQWNTGDYLPGTYTVTASIVDDTGTVANKATSTFVIANSSAGGTGAAEAALRTSTDRTTYNTSDMVDIADLVQSVTDNSILSLVHLHVTVTDSSGNTVGTYDHDLGQLAPGALDNVPDVLALNHAAQGQYSVAGTLTDSTGATLATGSATFTVAENLTKTLTGRVTVQAAKVYAGTPEVCTDTAINNGTLSLANQPLQALLVNLASGTTLSTTPSTASLTPGQSQQTTQTVDTTALAVGDYTCLLQAQENGSWTTLGYATFHVADPTADLAGTLTATPTQVPLTTNVALAGSVTNGGFAAIPGITATISIQDPSGNTVFSSPTSVGTLNQTQVNQLLANWTAAGNVGDVDTAILTATVGQYSRVLAQAQFTLLPPPIKLALSGSEPAFNRVLVLLNCPEGDEHEDDQNQAHSAKTAGHDQGGDGSDHQSDCIASRSATLNSLLTGLGVPYLLTTDVPDFMKALRSGHYNQYWVLGAIPEGDSNEEVSEELEEAVNRGDSLLTDGGLGGFENQELLQIAGADYKGQLPQDYQGPASLLAPVFTAASLPTATDDLNLVTTSGTEAATFSAPVCGDDGEHDHVVSSAQSHDGHDGGDHHSCGTQDVPAAIVNAYGQGHGAALGFDLLATLQQDPSAGWQAAVGQLMQYLTPTAPTSVPPLGYVPVATTVQNQGVATTLSVTDLLPAGAVDVDANPAPASNANGQVSWTAPLAVDQSLQFQAGISAPGTSGSYSLVSDVGTLDGAGKLTPYGSVSIVFTVQDTNSLEQTLTGELAAIAPNCHDDDSKERIADAQHEYQDALAEAAKPDWSGAIGELLEASEDLERLPGTAAISARLDLDHLIQAFELQWYATGANYDEHH